MAGYRSHVDGVLAIAQRGYVVDGSFRLSSYPLAKAETTPAGESRPGNTPWAGGWGGVSSTKRYHGELGWRCEHGDPRDPGGNLGEREALIPSCTWEAKPRATDLEGSGP